MVCGYIMLVVIAQLKFRSGDFKQPCCLYVVSIIYSLKDRLCCGK